MKNSRQGMTIQPNTALPVLRTMTTNRPVEVISYWRKEGMLLLDPPYQRGDVWGNLRRVNLIRSLLMGVPIPAIVVNDRMSGEWGGDNWHYAVIDGKQRCTSILMFLDGQLRVPGSWFGIGGNDIVFSDLPAANQRRFKLSAIGFCEASLGSLEAEREVFELINFGGVPIGEEDSQE